jgi:hypothetical protein
MRDLFLGKPQLVTHRADMGTESDDESIHGNLAWGGLPRC